MAQETIKAGPSPAAQGQFVCPLNYGLLPDIQYVADRSMVTEIVAGPDLNTVVGNAVASLGLAHAEPPASP